MGNNIQVPFSSFIQGGLSDGLDVVISGRPTPNFDRFSINLCSGQNLDQGDVALHFNARFNQGCVVRNHKQSGAWGAEETAGGMPFRRGHIFTIHMKVENHGYKVILNNRHFCDFTHRMPKQVVQYLYIEGDVTINFIQFRGGASSHYPTPGPAVQPPPSYPTGSIPPAYPPGPAAPGYPAGPPAPGYPGGPPAPGFPGYPPAGGFPPSGGAPPYHGAAVGPIVNPPMPVITPIQGGFYPGKIIYIKGTSHNGASRFHVNLACGFMESSDLALHFDARFNYGSDHNVIVCTHRVGGQYGAEEKNASYFPFFSGRKFEMMLLCEPYCIKVAVNSQHLLEFNHRTQPIQRIDHLQIIGGVSVSEIRFQ